MQVISCQFLFHVDFSVVWVGLLFLEECTALTGGLRDEIIVIEDDALEVVGALMQLPQFLIDGGLVVQDSDDELFIDIFARVSSIFKYPLSLFKMYQCKFKFLFLVQIDLALSYVCMLRDHVVKFVCLRRRVPLLFIRLNI